MPQGAAAVELHLVNPSVFLHQGPPIDRLVAPLLRVDTGLAARAVSVQAVELIITATQILRYELGVVIALDEQP